MSTLDLELSGASTHRGQSTRSTAAARGWMAPLLWGIAIIMLALIPYLAAIYGTPAGSFFRGALRYSTDEGQYLSATRMGMDGAWLWHDPYMISPPAPILIFESYMLSGHIGAFFHATPRDSFIAFHAFAVLLLVAALWRMGCLFHSPSERRWFVLFALCTSGGYWIDALLAVFGNPPAGLTRMGMQNVSGFSSGLIISHEGAGMAGHVIALTGIVGALYNNGARRAGFALYGVLGMTIVATTFSVFLPLTILVVGLFTLWWLATQVPATRRAAEAPAALAMAAIISVPGACVSLYYYITFSQPIWKNIRTLGQPSFAESFLTWMILVPIGVWGWWKAPARYRMLATVLALWGVCGIVGAEVNLFQQSRLVNGINLPIGGLFALGLSSSRPVVRRRWLMAVSISLVCQYLFILSVMLQGNAPRYYNTPSEQQAFDWLGRHVTAHDYVVAPFMIGNIVPIYSHARVVAGPFESFDYDLRQQQLRTFFGQGATIAQRSGMLRNMHATLVIYDAHDQEEGAFDPRRLPGLTTVFVSGDVAILRVTSSR